MPKLIVVKTWLMVKAMSIQEFSEWICCPIYSIETRKLVSFKENGYV
jgi:hypothetical protein